MSKKDGKYIKLDDIDTEILKIINEDVRTSYREISRSLEVSVGTVHNRIDKLIKSGVIKRFSPVLNHQVLGYILTNIIEVKIKEGNIEDITKEESINKNIVGIYDITGEYDGLLITKFKDIDELDVFIKTISKNPAVERTKTNTVLNVIKEDMNSSNIL